MKNCAILVTYNRKDLLVRGLSSVLAQQDATLNKIIIIDNASTDGTEEYLREKNILPIIKDHDIEIQYVKLQQNLGGAGGFNKGLSLAFEQGFDFFWVMDDDGFPDKNCLSQLLKYTDSYDFLSPLVLNESDTSKLSFGIDNIISLEKIKEKYKSVPLIKNKANPFNGVLFTRKLLERIGFPKADMFIWGDENEYQQRTLHAGINVATVISAIHYHPSNRVKFKMILGSVKVNIPEGNLRQYCYFRNYTYILKKYGSNISLVKWFVKYTFFFLMTLDVKCFILFIKAAVHALNNDFSHHKEYLK